MASEAEFERLYQEFVRNGGGTHTFDAANRTPAEFYNATSGTDLSPEQIAALEAAEEQFNRQAALNVVLGELNANNFTNPYDQIATDGIASYGTYSASPEIIAVASLASAINDIEDEDTRNQVIALFGEDPSNPTEPGDPGVGQAFLDAPTVGPEATTMYTDTQSHTNSQVSDFANNLATVAALANMNKSFGDLGIGGASSCSLFNELMGVLSGAFDGAFDFMKGIGDQIKNALSPILGVINGIKDQVLGFVKNQIGALVGPLLDGIKSVLAPVLGVVAGIANAVTGALGAIKDIAGQVAGEIAGLISMAEDLAKKALALALGAAALDPCQLAAILNVGSPGLAGAMSKLSTPLASAAAVVQTVVDPRAVASVVTSTMANATQAAATAPGVPQSPLRAAAEAYTPFSAYFHKIKDVISGVIGGGADIVKDTVTAVASGTGITDKITGAVTGTIAGKISDKITGKIGLAAPIVRSILGSQSGANSQDVGARSPKATTTIQSSAYRQFFSAHGKELLSTKASMNALIKRIENNQTGLSIDQKSRASVLIENLAMQQTKVSTLMSSVTNSLEYTVSGNSNRDDAKEAELTTLYEATLSSRSARVLSRGKTVLADTLSEWNSISSSVDRS